MNSTWNMYLNLLPLRIRPAVDKLDHKIVQETRLRLGKKPEIRTAQGSVWLEDTVKSEDLSFTVNVATRYSPWSSETVSSGYVTAAGGHRVGICGQAAITEKQINTIRRVTSVCIRAAHDFQGIASSISEDHGSVLILGRPGSGKTTLLRDLIRILSVKSTVSVIDEREELFPMHENTFCFPTGSKTDVLSGCSKVKGIDMVLRTMNPDYIAVDEITADTDCAGLIHAGWCGVKLLATAHAASINDLRNRPVYKPLLDSKLFDTLLVLRNNKTWYTERMDI